MLDYGDIKSVECKEAHSGTNKLNEVLQYWRDGKTCEESWKKIISIVDNDPLKNKSIADNICNFLARPGIKNEYLPSDQSGKI